jgi:polyhydroxybutyrate depolymerase
VDGDGRRRLGRRARPARAAAVVAAASAVVLGAAVVVVGAGAVRTPGWFPAAERRAPAARDVRPAPSAGCGRSRLAEGAAMAWVRSSGVPRSYVREVPSAHDGRHPLPLVVDLHGWGGPALAQADYTRLGRLGEVEGFVTLTPQGAGSPPAWDAATDSDDVAFLGDLLDEAERSLCIDTRRVFVAGASNGAMLASTVACVGAGRVAAVAAVAGVSPVLTAGGEDNDGCASARRPVPIMAIHGTDDPVVLWDGGFAPGVEALPGPDGTPIGDRQQGRDLSIPEVMGVWADRYGCDADPRPAERVADDVRVVEYRCPAGAAVSLVVVEGGGHGWPGANADPGWAPLAEAGEGIARTSDVSADKLMWAFFSAHPGGPAGRVASSDGSA